MAHFPGYHHRNRSTTKRHKFWRGEDRGRVGLCAILSVGYRFMCVQFSVLILQHSGFPRTSASELDRRATRNAWCTSKMHIWLCCREVMSVEASGSDSSIQWPLWRRRLFGASYWLPRGWDLAVIDVATQAAPYKTGLDGLRLCRGCWIWRTRYCRVSQGFTRLSNKCPAVPRWSDSWLG